MKKVFLWLVPSSIGIILLGLVWFSWQLPQKALAAQGSIFNSIVQWITNNSTTPTLTNQTWISNSTATTTYSFNTEGIDQVNLNIFTRASSTTANLYWYVAFTNATTTDSDTWFKEDVNTTSGAVITHTSNYSMHLWNPAATGTSTKNVLIQNINSKYMLVGFWVADSAVSATTTTSVIGMWAQAIISKPY